MTHTVGTGTSRTFWELSEKLQGHVCSEKISAEERTRAAVAMILCQGTDDIEVLFIQRATHDQDPWSGHIAFPGGKLEADEQECEAACRETWEETGMDLEEGHYIGRLSDIVGANLPVRVSCCLFEIDRDKHVPQLNDEVSDLFWVPLSVLNAPENHQLSTVAFGEKSFEVPAIRLPVDNKPVLWGITYRLVMQLIDVMDSSTIVREGCSTLPDMVEINEEVR